MNRLISTRKACLLCASLWLAGCATLAPEYVQPRAPVPDQIGSAAPDGKAASGVDIAAIGWRQVFADPRLQQVITTALAHNRDLRVALLNIDKAQAQYRIQRADLFPSVKASVSQSGSRALAAGQGTDTVVSRTYSADIGISNWELDLFGRIRSLSDEALETYLATEQAQRATRLSLVAEVADAWLSVGAYGARLALAEQTLQSQQQSLALTQRQHGLGVASGLDLAQVQTSVDSARADAANYRTELAKARNALELLVGDVVPESLLPDPATALDSGVALIELPPAIDSSVLLRRPDVLEAEHKLKAANADIGAARAAFFPSISLTTSVGRASTELNELFRGGSRTWSFVPSISVPIFQGGALQAQLDVSKVQARITVAQYEKTIQTAFSEVADALAERRHLQERLEAQDALVASSKRRYDLADARYRHGVYSYLEALDAQRSLYSAQQTRIDLQLTDANNRVLLFKTLGGGVDAQPEHEARE